MPDTPRTILEENPPLTLIDGDKRKPGRGKGCPKPAGSGRKRGVKNLLNHDMKQEILVRGKPLEVLCTVAAGRRMKAADPADPTKTVWTYPTADARVKAAGTLLAKLLPDVKSVELGNNPESPLTNPDAEVPAFETARRIAWLLASGNPNKGAGPVAEPAAEQSAAAFREALHRPVEPKPEPKPLEPNGPPAYRHPGSQYTVAGCTLHFEGMTPDGKTELWRVLDKTGMTKSTHEGLEAAATAARQLGGRP